MTVLVDPGRLAERDAFQDLVEPYRYQLQVHCYRMLGSFHEAEDLVQETLLRAWRARDRFQGRTSLRNWLYRIATNACLNALATGAKSPRVMPAAYGPPAAASGLPIGKPATEVAWLEPYPDAALPDVADGAPGPEAQYEMRESVQLAFVAAIQQLPPRQRAVLLLRDVLGWSANEAAQLLDSTVPSVNSALQRARASVEARAPHADALEPDANDAQQQDLLGRYIAAWEASDIDSLVTLLRADAVLSMPPWQTWYRGRQAIRTFLEWGMREGRRFRLVATRANGQPAFGQYMWQAEHAAAGFEAHALIVLTLDRSAISELTVFVSRQLVMDFGLPETVAAA
ncbi:MAG TPA: sigma-70 family RNA polymerase sigma factor [Ktedonobacterales bacterium]|nr:sigma-70 family RNA polymerase sigma factor [Ktedonobacterales bacterium]